MRYQYVKRAVGAGERAAGRGPGKVFVTEMAPSVVAGGWENISQSPPSRRRLEVCVTECHAAAPASYRPVRRPDP